MKKLIIVLWIIAILLFLNLCAIIFKSQPARAGNIQAVNIQQIAGRNLYDKILTVKVTE